MLNLLTTLPKKKIKREHCDANYLERSWWHRSSTLGSDYALLDTNIGKRTTGLQWDGVVLVKTILCQKGGTLPLTRAPLGYFYNAPHWGGGLFRAPPLISETTGPILKIQTAFERPGKTVEGKQILLTSGSRVTSQVRSKSKCSTFRAWWHRRAKLRC